MNLVSWLCLINGHDFDRVGDYLVCDVCGKRASVK